MSFVAILILAGLAVTRRGLDLRTTSSGLVVDSREGLGRLDASASGDGA